MSATSDLATKALGLLDAVSTPLARDLLEHRPHRSARVTVSPTALAELLDAVEAAYPGAKTRYLAAREVARREGKADQ